MKRTLILFAVLSLFSAVASAQTELLPPPDPEVPGGGYGGGTTTSTQPNVTDHGGAKMSYAKVVYLFWGSVPSGYAAELQAYRDAYGGMTEHLGMLGQYHAPQGSLTSSQPDVFDPAEPPYEVSLVDVRTKVAQTFGGRYDRNAIYVVVLPDNHVTSKPASDGTTERSCGGTNFRYCAYHQWFRDITTGWAIKYVVLPYAFCEGCRKYTLEGRYANDVQNAEIMTIHEVREAMTDPELNAWYDRNGLEADDKCAFSVGGAAHPENIFYRLTPGGPYDTPYYSPGHSFWFQKEWSNADHGCVE